jgi:hypothetical protein
MTATTPKTSKSRSDLLFDSPKIQILSFHFSTHQNPHFPQSKSRSDLLFDIHPKSLNLLYALRIYSSHHPNLLSINLIKIPLFPLTIHCENFVAKISQCISSHLYLLFNISLNIKISIPPPLPSPQ